MIKLLEEKYPYLETVNKMYNPSRILSNIKAGFVDFDGNSVKMDSLRYKTFRNSLSCVECGLPGVVMVLQRNKGSKGRYHFNLYGIKNGKPVLFTKDHIYPKSLGGKTTLDNLQTMCAECNEKKADKVI